MNTPFVKTTLSQKGIVSVDPSIEASSLAGFLTSDNMFCQTCGAAPGDIDDVTGCEAEFNITFMWDHLSGDSQRPGLKILCSTCDEGIKNITTEKPTWIWLLAQIRRARQDDQLAALNWLREKFEK